MRQRADSQIVFSLFGCTLKWSLQKRPQETLLKDFWPVKLSKGILTFRDLIECLTQSQNDFPFTSFRFRDVVKGEEIESFLSIWGENIFALGVKLKKEDDVKMLRLFLEKTPNLKKFYIDFGSFDVKYNVHLFADSNEFHLPQLHTLRVTGSCEFFCGVISDILKVASNLKCFEKRPLDDDDDADCITAKELATLQLHNKLYCLTDVNLLFKEDLIDFLEKSPQTTKLQLKCFKLSITRIYDNNELCARATEIIKKIFDSTKNSLLKLSIPPLGLLSGLEIPRFKNLQKLFLFHDESYKDDVSSMFPPFFEMAEHFPKLQELSESKTKMDKNLNEK